MEMVDGQLIEFHVTDTAGQVSTCTKDPRALNLFYVYLVFTRYLHNSNNHMLAAIFVSIVMTTVMSNLLVKYLQMFTYVTTSHRLLLFF